MHSQTDTETARAEDKADLGLHLWEGLARELIARGAITEAALARILDGTGEFVPALSNSEELRQRHGQIRERLERSCPTALQRADRDGLAATED